MMNKVVGFKNIEAIEVDRRNKCNHKEGTTLMATNQFIPKEKF